MRYIAAFAAACLLVQLLSCRSQSADAQQSDDVLVSVGDSTLTVSEVLRRIPAGLNPADSANMFERIVGDWVRDLVLIDVAEKNIPDMDRIDRMVEAYRNGLIVSQYLSTVSERAADDVPESRIKRYYETHRDGLVLDQPLVKGVFVKVAANDETLDNLRKWMSRLTDEDVDNIEKYGLRQATRYEYFRDEWHEWSVIAEQIPYRFFDADAFVSSSADFETEADGSVYILHISDYIPSGKEMPYEFARLKIREILRATDVASHRDRLMEDIYRERIRSGALRPGLYDPVGRKFSNPVDNSKNNQKQK
ncbi:MAG: peptidyl-prolyl cis-trans isomerase [Muribaculaceae bacterium]|nr:peptidyl-prolyl cis-trans isomerase [Muribaculaceae bacterium]